MNLISGRIENRVNVVFHPYNPHRKLGVVMIVIPVLGKKRQADSWCLMDSQPNLTDKLWVEPCLKNPGELLMKSNTQI